MRARVSCANVLYFLLFSSFTDDPGLTTSHRSFIRILMRLDFFFICAGNSLKTKAVTHASTKLPRACSFQPSFDYTVDDKEKINYSKIIEDHY